MIAVITGDIVNSRKENVEVWMPLLKAVLQQYGKSPTHWEVFRGDSFQLMLSPNKALFAAFHIKASIKQNKANDVRLAIGIGSQEYHAKKITESNGTAFVNSGECYENLKKQTMAIRSDVPIFDEQINLMLDLALLTADQWSSTVSETIKTKMEKTDLNQKQLAAVLKKSQSTISEALKRGGFEEIMNMNKFYQKNITRL